MKNVTVLAIIATLAVVSGNAYSAETEAKPVKAEQSAEGKIEARKEDKEAKAPFGASVGYSISTDFAEKLEPRLYQHKVAVDASYKFRDYFSMSFSTGYFFKTLSSSISGYEEDSGISHISLGISRNFSRKLGKFVGAEHSISAGASGSLPMMEEDRIEGAHGSVELAPKLNSKFFDRLFSISNRVYYQFIFNKFDFSPVSNEPTANGAYGWTVDSSIPIVGELSAGLGFGIRRTRYSDGFHSFSYSNSQSLSYSLGSLSMSVSHSNGGYTDDGTVELWYVDKYRRLVKATLAYSF